MNINRARTAVRNGTKGIVAMLEDHEISTYEANILLCEKSYSEEMHNQIASKIDAYAKRIYKE